jgi:hypothetical protein
MFVLRTQGKLLEKLLRLSFFHDRGVVDQLLQRVRTFNEPGNDIPAYTNATHQDREKSIDGFHTIHASSRVMVTS